MFSYTPDICALPSLCWLVTRITVIINHGVIELACYENDRNFFLSSDTLYSLYYDLTFQAFICFSRYLMNAYFDLVIFNVNVKAHIM